MEVLFRSYELDTANIIIGHYIKEHGYYMIDGKPDYDRPTVRHYIQDENCIKHEIAHEYLSISFPNMTDSENTKIFASLSEDGKGGDNLIYEKWDGAKEPQNVIETRFHQRGIDLRTADGIAFHGDHEKIKVVGIKKC